MRGNSRKYASDLGWRDLAELLGSLGEDFGVYVTWSAEAVSLVPFQVRISAYAYKGTSAYMQDLPEVVARCVVQSNHIEQAFGKLYWLAWDLFKQLDNKRSAAFPDEGASELPVVG